MGVKAIDVALDFVLRQQWLMTEEWLQIVIAVASSGDYFDEARAKMLEVKGGKTALGSATPAMLIEDGLARIPIAGPLFRHASMFDDISGATSYESIGREIKAAREDKIVRDVVFDIDSPGGEVAGLWALCDQIRALSASGKRTIAYVDGLGASAAYAIATACDEIVISPSAAVGSIGCVMATRVSDKEKEKGTIRFVSSQSPLKQVEPDTEAGAAQYQQYVDDQAAVFIDHVAKGRGVTADVVREKFGKGGIMVGARALAAGLADRIGTFESIRLEHAAKKKSAAQPTQRKATMNEDQLKVFCAALGLQAGASFEEMHGAVVSAMESHAAIGPLRKQVEELSGKTRGAEFRALLEGGFASNKLTIGRLMTVVPLLLSDEKPAPDKPSRREALTAALEALKADESKPTARVEVIAAAVGAIVPSEAELRTLSAYVAKAPALAAIEKAPARTDAKDAEDLEEEEKADNAHDAKSIEKFKLGATRALAAIEEDRERRKSFDKR